MISGEFCIKFPYHCRYLMQQVLILLIIVVPININQNNQNVVDIQNTGNSMSIFICLVTQNLPRTSVETNGNSSQTVCAVTEEDFISPLLWPKLNIRLFRMSFLEKDTISLLPPAEQKNSFALNWVFKSPCIKRKTKKCQFSTGTLEQSNEEVKEDGEEKSWGKSPTFRNVPLCIHFKLICQPIPGISAIMLLHSMKPNGPLKPAV